VGVVTIERVERGLAVLAYMMSLDGPVYAPLFEKLEKELEMLRNNEDTAARAKRLLDAYREHHKPRVLTDMSAST
jgi:hypothetical protein